MSDEDLIQRSTSLSLDAVCERLPDVAQRHQFGVLGMHDLRAKMKAKGVDFDRECRVFEVCNPQQARDVLSQAMEISTVLPCRISVYERDGKTVLATVKPTRLLGLFGAPEAAAAAAEVEATMARIIEETAQA